MWCNPSGWCTDGNHFLTRALTPSPTPAPVPTLAPLQVTNTNRSVTNSIPTGDCFTVLDLMPQIIEDLDMNGAS